MVQFCWVTSLCTPSNPNPKQKQWKTTINQNQIQNHPHKLKKSPLKPIPLHTPTPPWLILTNSDPTYLTHSLKPQNTGPNTQVQPQLRSPYLSLPLSVSSTLSSASPLCQGLLTQLSAHPCQQIQHSQSQSIQNTLSVYAYARVCVCSSSSLPKLRHNNKSQEKLLLLLPWGASCWLWAWNSAGERHMLCNSWLLRSIFVRPLDDWWAMRRTMILISHCAPEPYY